MRICLFTPNFLPAVGGTEVVTDALARQFTALGHHAVVLAQGRDVTLDVPYPVVRFPKPALPRLFPERIGRHLATLHDEHRFDVFLANYGAPTGYAAIRLGRRAGVPTVVVSHGGDLYRTSADRRRPHLWKRTAYAYRHADGLVAISPYVETLIRELNPQPALMELIPNGIDIAAITAPAPRPADFPHTAPFCLCLGNLGPLKGFADAIEAYARVVTQLGGLDMVIVGSGALDGELRAQAHRLGVADRVHFAGKRTGPDKRWFLHNARFGVMPSIEEGHPIVGLEFLASGKPLLCTTNAAFDGMYDQGVNALRVPAQRPYELAAALLRMANADLAVMGQESARRARAYDWPIIAGRYVQFLERVIARRRPR